MFTAASQIAILHFLIDDVSFWTIVVIVILMNMHHSLYGFSLVRYLSFKRFPRQIVAFGLTDFAYAVTIAKPENTNLAFLLGAEISIYLTWNIATGIALLSMQFLDVLQTLPSDFIVPLTFFLLLVTVIKNRRDILVAGFSMLIAIIFMLVGIGSASVTLVTIMGAGFGVMLHKFSTE
jgi:predicted branched-subunit amino acid permease